MLTKDKSLYSSSILATIHVCSCLKKYNHIALPTDTWQNPKGSSDYALGVLKSRIISQKL